MPDIDNTLTFTPDNALDIGASAATRPRNLYLGSTAVLPVIDTPLLAPSGNIIEQRNGTNPQARYLYNTYAGANFERLSMLFAGNNAFIMSEVGGTGTARDLYVGTQGAASLYLRTTNINRWVVLSTGELVAAGDNLFDIGQSTTNRPRNLYVYGDVRAGNNLFGTQLNLGSGGTASLTASGPDVVFGGSAIINSGIAFLNAAKTTYVRGDTPSAGWIQAQTNLSVPGKVSFSEGGIVKYLGQYAGTPTYSSATTGAWLTVTGTGVTATVRGAAGDFVLVDIGIPISHSANNAQIQVAVLLDGSPVYYANDTTTAAGNPCHMHVSAAMTVAAGSHTFAIGLVNGTTGTVTVVTGQYTIMRLLELRV